MVSSGCSGCPGLHIDSHLQGKQIRIWDFLIALVTDMVSLLSGIVSVILMILAYVHKWCSVPPAVFKTAALVCFFFASCRVWTTEHDLRTAADEHLKDLAIPELHGDIRQMWTSLNERKATVLFVGVTVKNSRAPSVIDNLKLSVKLKDGTEHFVDTEHFTCTPRGVFLLSTNDGTTHLEADDYLPIKALKGPIERGSIIRGWFGGEVKDLSQAEINDPGSLLIFWFSDVNNKVQQAFIHMSGGFKEGNDDNAPNKL